MCYVYSKLNLERKKRQDEKFEKIESKLTLVAPIMVSTTSGTRTLSCLMLPPRKEG